MTNLILSNSDLESKRDSLHERRAQVLAQELADRPLSEILSNLLKKIELELEELDHLHIISQLHQKIKDSTYLNLSQHGMDLYHDLLLEFSREVRSYIGPLRVSGGELKDKPKGRLFNVCSLLEKSPSSLLEHLEQIAPITLL